MLVALDIHHKQSNVLLVPRCPACPTASVTQLLTRPQQPPHLKPNILFSPNNPKSTLPASSHASLVASDGNRLALFRDALTSEKLKTAPPYALRDLTLSDATTNFNADGSFHLVMYPPNPAACASHVQQTGKVSCEKFKQDTCTIFDEYFKTTTKTGPRTFIESGGFDGTPEWSMTELMEKQGWEGLVVEATPGNYVQIAEHRPCVSLVESAASPIWGPVEFFGWGGCCSGIKDAMSDKFIETFHGKEKSKIVSYNVRSAPIVELIKAWGKTEVDFWVLDVEGAEKFVLMGMDFEQVKVGMIMIEISEQAETAREADDMLVKAGFFKSTTFQSWNNLNALYLNKGVYGEHNE